MINRMRKANEELNLRLTDPDHETRSSLLCFLNLVHGIPLKEPTSLSVIAIANAHVIAKKYACLSILNTIALTLESYIGIPAISPHIFGACIEIGRVDLAGLSIQKNERDQWIIGAIDNTILDEPVRLASIFDPRAWPVRAYERIPRQVLLALLRAIHYTATPVEPIFFRGKEVSEEFLRIMNEPSSLFNRQRFFQPSKGTNLESVAEHSVSKPSMMSLHRLSISDSPSSPSQMRLRRSSTNDTTMSDKTLVGERYKNVKDYQDTMADVSLISSDGFLFKVDSFRLKAAR